MRIGYLSRYLLGSFLIAAVLLSISPISLFACDITLKADKTAGNVGDIVQLDVTVRLTHRNCPVPMADTRFVTTSNLAVLGQTDWVSIAKDTFKTVLRVQLLAPGTGKLEVIRDCLREGGYGSITLQVGGSGVIEIPPDTIPPTTDDTQVVIAVSGSNTDDRSSEITWTEAFKNVLIQPFIWVYLGLVIFAYFALLRRQRRWRFISLAFSMVYLGFFLGLCPCAISAIQNVVLHVGEPKAYLAQFVILAIPVTSTLFLGRIYCGWICPMGAVQQFLYRRDLSLKLPSGLGGKLKWLRFGVLGGIIVAALYTGSAAFAQIDPFKSLFNAQISPVPTTLLVIILAASIFVFTPWCRFLCPMGAVLSVVGRLARRSLSFKTECKNCGACARSFCDYKAITPGKPLPVIEQHECARCGECLARCPRDGMGYELPEPKIRQPAAPTLRPAPEMAPLPEPVLSD